MSNFWLTAIVAVQLLLCCAPFGDSLSVDDLYLSDYEDFLLPGEKFRYVKLNTSVHFYGNTYDHLYVC